MKEKNCHQRVVSDRKFLCKQLRRYAGDVTMKYARAQTPKHIQKFFD